MPAIDPRLGQLFDEQDFHAQTYVADGTINLPTISGPIEVKSTMTGFAVTLTGTGTGTPLCGLGAAGNPLLGKIKVVDEDGRVSVQDTGYMTLPYVTGGNQPVQNGFVGVDGTGKVQNVAAFSGAKCIGFIPDLQAPGPTLLCVVKI
jgi:hypothetical protein